MGVLRIIRGLPGSGKSTKAKEFSALHIEADMFFIRNGKYVFKVEQSPEAHEVCRTLVHAAMMAGMDVTVSNTFVMNRQMEPYIRLAKAYDYIIEIIECKGRFNSIHEVPEEVMVRMQNQWEENDMVCHKFTQLGCEPS